MATFVAILGWVAGVVVVVVDVSVVVLVVMVSAIFFLTGIAGKGRKVDDCA